MKKILCVDDNVQMLYLIREFLVRGGFDVLVAENGVMALDQFFTNFDICVVVTDIEMPEMDGNELARRIRDSERKGVAVIAATGSREADIEDVLFDHVLQKPFDLLQLEALCRLHAREQASNDEHHRLVGSIEPSL